VTEVADITGHPEIMGGRVKTLHPAVHGPLLARRDVPADLEALANFGYRPIDVVVVNLYPFRQTVARGGVAVPEAMEQVDIGGPTMIRAAAKNHAHVWVVVDPADYGAVVAAVEAERRTGVSTEGAIALRRRLAAKVFRHISSYDEAVADYLEGRGTTGAGAADTDTGASSSTSILRPRLQREWDRGDVLRYGENPDQEAALYQPAGSESTGIAALDQFHGKSLSYNNLLDLDGALLSLAPFAFSPRPAVCIVKHTTPCGLGLGDTVEEAFRRALATDPVSAFGSIIAVNRPVDEAAALALSDLFVECVVAPSFSDAAVEVLTRKKNLRLLTFPRRPIDRTLRGFPAEMVESGVVGRFETALESHADAEAVIQSAHFLAVHGRLPDPLLLRGIYGGLLAQTPPTPPFYGVEDSRWRVVSERKPTDAELDDMAFAWAAVFGVKSNAILLARGGATLGIGAGQMSRVDSSRLAVQKAVDAGFDVEGAAMASDAFFPFRDGVDAAAEKGVRAIIQPGGSVRDQEVVAAADEHGIAMIFTGRRLFRH
ncbi:MAG: bifunctional phosphoribosylaminoimidazolecarboxamide formyltransferase/IMP cyclohydrolase PurH, partial [Gemmatimonadales bacterium]